MNRVLLVDDDEKFLEVYSEILISNGYETETASSGEECLKKLRAEFFNRCSYACYEWNRAVKTNSAGIFFFDSAGVDRGGIYLWSSRSYGIGSFYIYAQTVRNRSTSSQFKES